MEIKRSGSQPSAVGPADWFTGRVRIDAPFKGGDPARVAGAIVTFEPGARTAWHSHPVGQTLFCLSGAGRVQREGEQVQEFRAGDTVIIPPNVRHWHGAAPDKLFSHMAMSEQTDKGEGTAWFEHVSDDDYNASPAPVT